MQRRLFVSAARRAAVALYGDAGLDDIAKRLPDDTRAEFFRAFSDSDWIACRHVVHWCFATWQGPAHQQRPRMAEFLDRQFDFGYGVIRRAILRLADPRTLAGKLAPFWKQDYTSGDLQVEVEPSGQSLTCHLRDHPFTETPHARASIAEVYRYAFSLTRACDVTETHGLESPGVMVFRLRWL